MRDYAPAIELTGEMRAKQKAVLAAEVSGKVISIAHRVGEANNKDSVLISIDPSSYEAALSSATAQLEAARQRLAELQAGTRSEEIAAQEASVASARARSDQAQDNLSRQQALYEQGVISEASLTAARSAAEAAKAELDNQQQKLDQLRAGPRKETLAAQKALVDAAQSQVDAASIALQRTSIAPAFDCVVSSLMVEVGQFVGPGTPLCEVVADGVAEAWFNVGEIDAASLGSGDEVEIRSDALPGEVVFGTILSLAPDADPTTRQFPVRVAVTDERLKAGMSVRGRILTADLKPTLMISEDSPVESKLGKVVYRMVLPAPDAQPGANGMPPLPSVESIPVETAEHIDGMVVVTSGDLKPGDMLVTRGKEQLYPSAKIIPTNLQGGGPPGAAAPAGGDAAEAAGEAGGQAASATGEASEAPKDSAAPAEHSEGGGK